MSNQAQNQKVVIQLGRFGDEILLLPCWLKHFQDTGVKPVVIVSRDYASVFQGVSYVQPDVINAQWYMGMPQARQMAALKYGEYAITQCHGHCWGVDMDEWPTFGESMWARAGFPGQYGTLPMAFDRRNPAREERLMIPFARARTPILLYNLHGISSPFNAAQAVLARLRRYARRFTLVNLAGIRAKFIYDLLGLYDRAAGLISVDTSTAHLAAASKVPMLAFRVGAWNSMKPKPGAVEVFYKDALDQLDAVDRFIESLKPKPMALATA